MTQAGQDLQIPHRADRVRSSNKQEQAVQAATVLSRGRLDHLGGFEPGANARRAQ